MGTSLGEIFDLFMMTVTDYRLDALFNTSESDFENYLQAWLMFAITDFRVCDQDLTFDETTKEFTVTLSSTNKVILAKLMIKYWMTKVTNDITQLSLHVTDRDFKVASEAQNLREKTNALNVIKEECSQLLQDYGYDRVEWTDWNAQNFG